MPSAAGCSCGVVRAGEDGGPVRGTAAAGEPWGRSHETRQRAVTSTLAGARGRGRRRRESTYQFQVKEDEILHRAQRFLHVHYKDFDLPLEEAVAVQLEWYRLWTVLALYGIGFGAFRDSLEMHMNWIQRLIAAQQDDENELMLFNAAMALLDAYCCLATPDTNAAQPAKRVRFADVDAPSSSKDFDWNVIECFLDPVDALLQKHLQLLAQSGPNNYVYQSTCASMINYLASYLEKARHVDTVRLDVGRIVRRANSWFETVVQLTLTSVIFFRLFSKIDAYSTWKRSVVSSASPANLPKLCSRTAEPQVISSQSPFNMLIALFRLMNACVELDPDLISQIERNVLKNDHVCSYIAKIASSHSSDRGRPSWLRMADIQLAHLLFKLANRASHVDKTDLWHVALLQVVTCGVQGAENYINEMVSKLMFSSSFLRDCALDELPEALSSLHLKELHLNSAAGEMVVASLTTLQTECVKSLPAIQSVFEQYLARPPSGPASQKETLLCSSCFPDWVLPADWVYLPIIINYKRSQKKEFVMMNMSSLIIDVSRNLQWIFLLEQKRSKFMQPMSKTLRFSRLLFVFLFGSDLFLDRRVYGTMAALLRLYSSATFLDRLNLDEHIDGIPSFHDLYVQLVLQFEAESFGDSLFASYLLIPLYQQHDQQYKMIIWSEYSTMLRSLFLSVQQVLIPIEGFLEPEELDVKLIRIYAQSLLGGTVSPQFCPFMYWIAVHHVNRFIFDQGRSTHLQLQKAMAEHFYSQANQEIKRHVLLYKNYIKRGDKQAFEQYEELPPLRKQWLTALLGKSPEAL